MALQRNYKLIKYIWAMEILNSLPLIGCVLGVAFAGLIFFNKEMFKQNRRARIALGVVLLLGAHNLFDSYLLYNGYYYLKIYSFSYLHFHLIGFILLYYTNTIWGHLKIKRVWFILLAGYTLFRFLVFFPVERGYELSFPREIEWTDLVVFIDYYLSLSWNIIPLVNILIKSRRIGFSVELTPRQLLEYKWMKGLLLLTLLVHIAIFANGIVGIILNIDLIFALKIETLILSFVFFGFVFIALRFPVFAVSGNYSDLPTDQESEEKEADMPTKKYASSNLQLEASHKLWKMIEEVMENEHPYQNPEFRLNDLAQLTGDTLHHVSQAINEHKGIGFADFINGYRVEDAKKLLIDPKSKDFTILAIAYEVGFNSKTAFYNAFKKNCGQTPSQFKKENQA